MKALTLVNHLLGTSYQTEREAADALMHPEFVAQYTSKDYHMLNILESFDVLPKGVRLADYHALRNEVSEHIGTSLKALLNCATPSYAFYLIRKAFWLNTPKEVSLRSAKEKYLEQHKTLEDTFYSRMYEAAHTRNLSYAVDMDYVVNKVFKQETLYLANSKEKHEAFFEEEGINYKYLINSKGLLCLLLSTLRFLKAEPFNDVPEQWVRTLKRLTEKIAITWGNSGGNVLHIDSLILSEEAYTQEKDYLLSTKKELMDTLREKRDLSFKHTKQVSYFYPLLACMYTALHCEAYEDFYQLCLIWAILDYPLNIF